MTTSNKVLHLAWSRASTKDTKLAYSQSLFPIRAALSSCSFLSLCCNHKNLHLYHLYVLKFHADTLILWLFMVSYLIGSIHSIYFDLVKITHQHGQKAKKANYINFIMFIARHGFIPFLLLVLTTLRQCQLLLAISLFFFFFNFCCKWHINTNISWIFQVYTLVTEL